MHAHVNECTYMYANKVIHILLNYIHAFFYSVFIGVSERQETETTIRKLKIKKKIDKDLENYRKWIQRSRNVYMLLPSLVLFHVGGAWVRG